MAYVSVAARCLIGVVFVWAVAGKLRAFDEFARSVRALSGAPRIAVRAVVIAEAAVPVLLLAGPTTDAGFALALGLLAAFSVTIFRALRRGSATPCRCFGASSTPLGRRHLVRNGLLAVVTIAGAFVPRFAGGSEAYGGMVVACAAGLLGAVVLVFFDDIVGLFAATQGRPG